MPGHQPLLTVGADRIGIPSLEHREPGTREKAAGLKAAII
jgi:hypothetical protein